MMQQGTSFRSVSKTPHFLISHRLPDSSESPWATSALFVSQDEPDWHSALPFLNFHLQAISKPLFLLTPGILKVQHVLPEMETADAV